MPRGANVKSSRTTAAPPPPEPTPGTIKVATPEDILAAVTEAPRAVAVAKTIPTILETYYARKDKEAFTALAGALAGRTDPATGDSLWRVVWAVETLAVANRSKEAIKDDTNPDAALAVYVVDGQYLLDWAGEEPQLLPTPEAVVERLQADGRCSK